MNDSDPKSAADGSGAVPALPPESRAQPPADGMAQAAMNRTEHQATERRRALSRWTGAGLVVAVIVIVALAATLRHQQQQLNEFGREASRRLDEAVSQVQSARQQAQAAQQTAQSADRRLTDLESRTRQLQEQQETLDQAWHDIVAGEEASVLVDVEQSLMLASEQLQLAGRVPSAIAALQVAEARLARAARPAYRPAQQAIARDLKRLQALPYQDFVLAVEQIDAMLKDVAEFPLKAPGLGVPPPSAGPQGSSPAPATPAVPAEPAEAAAQGDWWQQAWQVSQAWAERTRDAAATELRRLVEVRRVDEPDALLLSADQADILRANLMLRLVEARMALLARVDGLWIADLAVVRQAVVRYGEPNSPITRRLLRQLDELQAVDPAPDLPTLDDSLRTVRSLLSGIEGEPAGNVPPADDASPDEAVNGASHGAADAPSNGAQPPATTEEPPAASPEVVAPQASLAPVGG